MTRNTHLSAGTTEPPFACAATAAAPDTARNKRGRQERPENANSRLTCDPPGGDRGAHADEVQTEFMTALSPPLLSPRLTPPTPVIASHRPPASGRADWEPLRREGRRTRHHSLGRLPRCLCQVIAGGKRKTDQYISHGPDR